LFFAFDITVPAGRLEASPLEETLKMTKGMITDISIKFPAGCHGMVKVRLLHEESQLVPLSRDEWVTGDDEIVPSEVHFNLSAETNMLKFVGCSPGTSYDHTVSVRINQLSEEEASTAPLTRMLLKMLQRMGLVS
jgi:hypothetical protein